MSEFTANKPSALVIDDELQIRRLLRLCLEGGGYRVLEAATGEEGLGLASQHPPDVVLLDLGLPDMDGMAVLKRLRQWSNLPVIVLSVRDDEQDKVTALDSGADDYVTKPFHAGELLPILPSLDPFLPCISSGLDLFGRERLGPKGWKGPKGRN
jgi:two-component system KDP operon response regulator KdpE